MTQARAVITDIAVSVIKVVFKSRRLEESAFRVREGRVLASSRSSLNMKDVAVKVPDHIWEAAMREAAANRNGSEARNVPPSPMNLV